MFRTCAVFALVGLLGCHNATEPKAAVDCLFQAEAEQVFPNGLQTDLILTPSANCGGKLLRSTIEVPPGTWMVLAKIIWAPNERGLRGMTLVVDGKVATETGSVPLPEVTTSQFLSWVVRSEGGALIRATGTQTSGADLTTWFKAGATPSFILILRLD